jgi:hypothetical protein
MEKMNIKEAARYWVRGFNAIPQNLITKAYPYLNEDGLEVLVTDKECTYCGNTDFEKNEEDELVCSSCGHSAEEYASEKYDLPMWGTMWTFEEGLDEDWARENLEIMHECGFWVYDSDELGLVFGIDGAGYDFYESHWIPLYKARGLQWHT